MRAGIFIVLASAAVLYGAPPSASATQTGSASPPAGHSNAAPSADPASAQADPTLGPLTIAIGIGGIVAMALFAWLVPPALRRRRRAEPRWPDALDDEPSRRTTTEEHVTAALHRRTLRRARVRLEEDPIIASMRVGTPAGTERGARRARRTARRSPPT